MQVLLLALSNSDFKVTNPTLRSTSAPVKSPYILMKHPTIFQILNLCVLKESPGWTIIQKTHLLRERHIGPANYLLQFSTGLTTIANLSQRIESIIFSTFRLVFYSTNYFRCLYCYYCLQISLTKFAFVFLFTYAVVDQYLRRMAIIPRIFNFQLKKAKQPKRLIKFL